MSTEAVRSNVFYLESVSGTENLDELLADEEFFVDLIDLINSELCYGSRSQPHSR